MTSTNVTLLALLLYLIYTRFIRKEPPILAKSSRPIVFKSFTPLTLRPFDGTDDRPVYIAVRGRVFDVTPGKGFYGPGGPYANFAGRDASRGLACGSFDEDMLTKDLNGPLDSLKDLGEEELEALTGWEERFQDKYLEVGRLVAVSSDDAKAASP
jgi:membrane-associated progesterone receptor component